MATHLGGVERRKQARFLCGASTAGRVLGAGGPMLDGVLDISPGGACVVLPGPVGLGAALGLELYLTLSGFACRVTLRVVHVRVFPGGHYMAGGAFDRHLSDAEVRELL